MKRVLVVEPAGNLWGSERALLDLLDGLEGWQAAVCCPPRAPLVSLLAQREIEVLPYFVSRLHEKSRWSRLKALVGLLRACFKFKPDLLYLNQGGSFSVALPAALALRLPIVAHVRIFEDVDYLARKRSIAGGRLRALIAISDAIEEEIRQHDQLKAIRCHRIYDAYRSSSSEATPIGRRESRVVCVGRLAPVKGQAVLIEALSRLRPIRPDVELVLVGDGADEFIGQLRQLASEQDVASAIEWTGFVDEVAPLVSCCSVLVCPSHREPLGRVIFEAWDAGAVPVVFGGSGGAAEIIVASGGGVLYDEQDPVALAEGLLEALELGEEERLRLIERGRLWMADHCDPVTYGRAISEVFLEATRGVEGA